MKIRAVAFLSATLLAPLAQADVQCSPTTPKGSQARTGVKHRASAAGAAGAVSVAEMINWPVPTNLNDPTVRRSNATIDPREERAFTLTGDLWRVKVEDNDCDLHLEVSASGGSDTDSRVIVEVPQEHLALRNRLIKAVKDSGRGDLTAKPQLDFTTALPITVTGLAFVDSPHWNKDQPKKGKSHGTQFVATLWELHPLFDLNTTPAGAAPGLANHAPSVVPAALPHPDHIVVVIEENKNYAEVIGSPSAPYLNSLLPHAALLTDSHGLHHPSQPNYLELFSGSSQGVCNDDCPHTITAPNLAASILANPDPTRNTFIGYAEHFDPSCSSTPTPQWYAQKHCPWRDFTNPVPATVSKDFTAFPKDFTKLPAVSFVIPSLIHDMHNPPAGPHNTSTEVRDGDAWLRDNLNAYVQWASAHNSLLIITWDEDNSHYAKDTCHPPIDTPTGNRIPTIIAGAHVNPGMYATTYTHYNVLRTIEDMEGIAPLGGSASVSPITGIWQ